jgi:uncharacterized RDD family membrane protein YckC
MLAGAESGVARGRRNDLRSAARIRGRGAATVTQVSVGLAFAFNAFNTWYLNGKGQSVSKMALRIRLVGDRTGRPIGFALALRREFSHAYDTLACYIGWFMPLWDAKQQTIADKVCASIVVRT